MGTRANSVVPIHCWLKTPSTGVLLFKQQGGKNGRAPHQIRLHHRRVTHRYRCHRYFDDNRRGGVSRHHESRL